MSDVRTLGWRSLRTPKTGRSHAARKDVAAAGSKCGS